MILVDVSLDLALLILIILACIGAGIAATLFVPFFKYKEAQKKSEKLLKNAFERLGMSARSYSRVLKVARTIADLDGEVNISVKHVAEALNYRGMDRNYV